jgi:pSer/pThr/pTyr-binding forkhead associated (FHA) protein
MKIRLKVLKGSAEGKEIKIPTPECLIGRSSECDLRPKSDAISRRHCAIVVKDGTVLVREFGSKNGTFVNGRRVEGELVVNSGDTLQVGPLAFEIVVDHTLGGEKKSKVNSVKEAAARTTQSSRDSALLDDSDISSWLAEADEMARDQVTLQRTIEERARKSKEKQEDVAKPDKDTKEEAAKDQDKKKGPGKLPARPDAATKDSREAATVMLKKFFNNR